MRVLADMAKRFRQDEDGAAMVEYSVLIGIITVALIATIGAVAAGILADWAALCAVIGVGCPA